MLEIRGLRKSFGALEVLRGIDLTVNKGDVVAILGSSGSGKTTLLRCLNFLETSDAGAMTFDGETFQMAQMRKKDVARLRARTAFVFQDYNLFLNKTALENVTEGLIVARRMPKDQAVDLGRRMLAKVGLSDREGHYPSQLSGGQQQRGGLARARAPDPQNNKLDEPTTPQDPARTREVLSVMRDLAEEGRTMLVVTHEMGFARHVSNQVIFMDHGEVVESGTSREVFDHPQQERTRAFLRNIYQAGMPAD